MLKVATMLHNKFTIRTEGSESYLWNFCIFMIHGTTEKEWKVKKTPSHKHTRKYVFLLQGKCTKHVVLTLAIKGFWIPTEPNPDKDQVIQARCNHTKYPSAAWLSMFGHSNPEWDISTEKTFTMKLFRYYSTYRSFNYLYFANCNLVW